MEHEGRFHKNLEWHLVLCLQLTSNPRAADTFLDELFLCSSARFPWQMLFRWLQVTGSF